MKNSQRNKDRGKEHFHETLAGEILGTPGYS